MTRVYASVGMEARVRTPCLVVSYARVDQCTAQNAGQTYVMRVRKYIITHAYLPIDSILSIGARPTYVLYNLVL